VSSFRVATCLVGLRRSLARNKLAHSFLEPLTDGSVVVARLQVARGELKGVDKEQWTQNNFKDQIKELNKLTAKLQSVKSDLSTLKITLRDIVFSAGTGVSVGKGGAMGRIEGVAPVIAPEDREQK
jgi:hypothetical protein